MGCWCGTCAITHLPINAGDKVRLFFMTMQDYGTEKEGAGFCYSNGVWYPRGLPVSGSYDDYGGIEDIKEDLLTKILVDGINKDWAPYKASHQWEKDTVGGNLTIYQIVEETERDRAKIHDGESKIEHERLTESLKTMHQENHQSIDIDAPHAEDREARPFGFIMVHEDVYQAMLAYDPPMAHHKEGGYVYRKRSEVMSEDMKEFYLAGLQTAQDTKNCNPKLQKLLLSSGVSHWNIFSHTSMSPDPPFCKGVSYYWDFLRTKMAEGAPYEDPEVQIVVNGLIDFYKFSWSMQAARRAWMPQSGKGSQQNDLDIYKVIEVGAQQVIKAREETEAEWRDDDAEPDENGFTPYMIEHNKEMQNKGSDAKESQ